MSDPNAPKDPIGDDAIDPVDRAYAEAEALLHDDAERAARRARVLGAVAAQAEPRAEPAPAPTPVVSTLPPPRRTARQPVAWLMAASVAGVVTLVGLRVAPPDMWRSPQIEPAPSTPNAGAVRDATPPPLPPQPTAPPPTAAAPSAAKGAPPPVQARAPAAGQMDETPPPALPIPPVQLRVETPAPPPPPSPIPSVASRAEASAAPRPLPIPPVARRVETPAPPAAMAIGPAYGEVQRPALITNPDWARRPTVEDLAQYYPDRARRTETNGSATLSCAVKANGTLEDCTIVSETPTDYGFGGAALKLARIYRMRPKTSDGAPIEGGRVRFQIVFKVPT